jgi:DNA-binding CsgD family transcriptional regulator
MFVALFLKYGHATVHFPGLSIIHKLDMSRVSRFVGVKMVELPSEKV